ncbi:hypothetical protein LCGC14_0487700 [marine sediment metagenome]|uniref:Uncharacterized protein n=1 Tax=marine sediment metagenome TaxID=412755 RepID=A0A0F9S7H6_9ZZZZ
MISAKIIDKDGLALHWRGDVGEFLFEVLPSVGDKLRPEEKIPPGGSSVWYKVLERRFVRMPQFDESGHIIKGADWLHAPVLVVEKIEDSLLFELNF